MAYKGDDWQVNYVFFLPPLVYGIQLAIAGDWSLLLITSVSFLIAGLPKILGSIAELNQHKSEEANENQFEHVNYVLPDVAITGDVSIEGDTDICRSFAKQLFWDSKEELWCLSDCLVCYESLDKSTETMAQFISRLEDRAKVPLPFTLVLESKPEGELEDLLLRLVDRPFRIISLGFALSTANSKFRILDGLMPARVSGQIAGEPKSLILSEDSLTGQPAYDLGDYGPPTSNSLDLIGGGGGKHRTPSSNKPKWFDFPLRRNVINKAKPGFRSSVIQNQMSQGLSEQVRGADSITDISTRLRQLGHGI